MHRHALVALSGIAVLLASQLPGAAVAIASPEVDSVSTLPDIGDFRDIVVDESHQHVLVGGTKGLAVADLSGHVTLAHVPGVAAATGMALDPDAEHLVVSTDTRLLVLDARSLKVTRSVDAGANHCPGNVAPASGLMFFGYVPCDDDSTDAAGVGALNTDTGHVTPTVISDFTWNTVYVASTLTQPSTLIVSAGDNLAIYDTTGGPSPSAHQRASRINYPISDVALTPDGTEVVTVDASRSSPEILAAADLSQVGTYPTANGEVSGYPRSLAVRDDGRVLAGLDSTYGTDLYFFDQDSQAPTRTVDYGVANGYTESRNVGTRSVAFGDVDSYVVTDNGYGELLRLRHVASGPRARLTMSTPRKIHAYGGTVRLNIKMLDPTTNRRVTVYAQPAGQPRRLLGTRVLNPAGQASIRATVRRNTRFDAVFAGDHRYSEASISVHGQTRGRTVLTAPSARTSRGTHLVRRGDRPTIRVHVLGPNPGACVGLRVQRLRHGVWDTRRSMRCRRLNAASRTSIRLGHGFHAGDRVRVGARFHGGVSNQPTGWRWIRLRFSRV